MDSEEDPGRNYMRCKPMASLFLAAAAAREVEQGPEGAAAEVSLPAFFPDAPVTELLSWSWGCQQ